MKKMIFLAVLTVPLMSGIMFMDYQPLPQKKEATHGQTKMVPLNAVQRSEFESKIKTNEKRIVELNKKIKKQSELLDPFYVTKIANLEKENRYLQARLEAI
jgi:hypothetical protein